MTEKLEVIRGSKNVFADLGLVDADVLQMKAHLAGETISTLDKRKLSNRKAAPVIGLHFADVGRIRCMDLERFTIDRLVNVLNRLNRHVEVKVTTVRKSPRSKTLEPA